MQRIFVTVAKCVKNRTTNLMRERSNRNPPPPRSEHTCVGEINHGEEDHARREGDPEEEERLELLSGQPVLQVLQEGVGLQKSKHTWDGKQGVRRHIKGGWTPEGGPDSCRRLQGTTGWSHRGGTQTKLNRSKDHSDLVTTPWLSLFCASSLLFWPIMWCCHIVWWVSEPNRFPSS